MTAERERERKRGRERERGRKRRQCRRKEGAIKSPAAVHRLGSK
jgi:hypothetical protein